jgi:galacturan 1,4-alpha-galacturonidase
MRFQLVSALTIAWATLSVATPTWNAVSNWEKSNAGKKRLDHTSPRPQVFCHPHHPHVPPPASPPRHKVCYVKSHGDSVTDDTPYIMKALHDCNNGGHVVFREGVEYFISTTMDLTFLNHIDIGENTKNIHEYLS